MKTYLVYLFYSSLVLLASSCEKWINVDPPVTELASSTVFEDENTAVSAISGIYSRMMQSSLQFTNSGLTLYTGMTADELVNAVAGTNDQFSKNNLNASNTTVATIWANAYNYIYQANAIIEGLNGSSKLGSAVKNQIMGEALFVRSFCLFHLTNLFGEVPLITGANYQINMNIGASSKERIYEQIIADLKLALPLLSNNYLGSERTRPNNATIRSFLARVYLYAKVYDLAIAASTSVIEDTTYSLNTDIQKIFLANSNETIFQLMPVSNTMNTWEGSLLIPSSATIIPAYRIRASLFSSIAENDLRKTAWIKTNRVNGVDYQYPYKYKVRSGALKTEYNIVFRLAEQYLIRAEAYMEMNRLRDAIKDVNKIRYRAGLVDIPEDTPKDELGKLIAQEKRHEFFAEWGHRWFDLKRKGLINIVMQQEKGNDWATTDGLFPIPLVELNKNILLIQNTGY